MEGWRGPNTDFVFVKLGRIPRETLDRDIPTEPRGEFSRGASRASEVVENRVGMCEFRVFDDNGIAKPSRIPIPFTPDLLAITVLNPKCFQKSENDLVGDR